MPLFPNTNVWNSGFISMIFADGNIFSIKKKQSQIFWFRFATLTSFFFYKCMLLLSLQLLHFFQMLWNKSNLKGTSFVECSQSTQVTVFIQLTLLKRKLWLHDCKWQLPKWTLRTNTRKLYINIFQWKKKRSTFLKDWKELRNSFSNSKES